jgi:hypothetical protein
VDRNGRLLAMDLTHYGVYLDPNEVWDAQETRRILLAALPKLSKVRLERTLKRTRRGLLIAGLTPQERVRIRDLGLPGISFEPEQRRVYPLGAQAAHLIGFTDFGGQGIAGAERALDAEMRAAGQGGMVPLSIDLRVQAALEDEVQKAGMDQRAKGAVGIVSDVVTGEILAMASYPDYHPGDPGTATPEQLLNRTTQSVYEMGSTFKGITIAAGLDSGAITRQSTFDATQPFRMAGRTIRDFHATNRVLTTDEVFTKSSNIGTSRIAFAVGPERFSGYLRDLGLFERAAIELKESARPILPAKWNENTLASASFGHAISVSPIALTGAMHTIVNGGYQAPLTIHKRTGPAPRGQRVLTAETSRAMLELMRLNVIAGSGARRFPGAQRRRQDRYGREGRQRPLRQPREHLLVRGGVSDRRAAGCAALLRAGAGRRAAGQRGDLRPAHRRVGRGARGGRGDRPHPPLPEGSPQAGGRTGRSRATRRRHRPDRRSPDDDTMRLSELLRRDVPVDPEITGVTADSRQVRPGYLFAALPGSASDGRAFVPQALSAGAVAVLATDDDAGPLPLQAPIVGVGDVRRAYALAAAAVLRGPAARVRRGDGDQRQDQRRRLLPPDLRPSGLQGGQHGDARHAHRRPGSDPARPDHAGRGRRGAADE